MNQRLEYVDALRGLSMILVVFGHALLFMGLPTDTTLVGAVLLTFRMPLFFFVSGFFAYKLSTKWTKDKVLDVLSRKVKAQVISTLVFYSIFQICRQKYLFEWLDHGFSWFWFTIALFQMFCIYLVFALIEKRIKSHNFAMLSLIIISLGLRLFNIIHPSIHIRCATIFEWFYLCQYFQFFVFGLLCRKCFKRFETLLNSDWFRTISILTFISSLIALYSYDRYLLSYSTKTYKTIAEFIVRYSGLISLFIIFYSSRNQIESHAGGGGSKLLEIHRQTYFGHLYAPCILFANFRMDGSISNRWE